MTETFMHPYQTPAMTGVENPELQRSALLAGCIQHGMRVIYGPLPHFMCLPKNRTASNKKRQKDQTDREVSEGTAKHRHLDGGVVFAQEKLGSGFVEGLQPLNG